MKKTRLLEIVREEIAFALNEVGQSPEEQKATNLAIAAEKAKIAAAQKQLQQLQKSGVSETELEEDLLNEKPFIDSAFDITGTSPEDLGKDPLQNAIDNAVKILKKENPDADVKRLAADIQKVNSAKNLGPQSKLSPEVKSALQKIADVIEKQGTIFGTKAKIDDLIKLTSNPSQIDRLEKLKEKGFTYVIGNPQAVTAVEKSLGLKPKNDDVLGTSKDKPKSEPKAKEKSEKPESTGKKGRPAGAAKEKVATRTPGADGFDDVSYSDADSEDKEAIQSIGSDPTAKELGNISSRKDKIVKAYRDLEPQKQDKIAKAKAGDKEAADWLKNTWTPILKAYNKAQQVNV